MMTAHRIKRHGVTKPLGVVATSGGYNTAGAAVAIAFNIKESRNE